MASTSQESGKLKDDKSKKRRSIFRRLFPSKAKTPAPQPVIHLSDDDSQSQNSQNQAQDHNSALWQEARSRVQATYSKKEWAKITKNFSGQSDELILNDALKSLDAAAKARGEAQWTIRVHGGKREVKIRETVDTIVGYANQFKDAGAAIAQADPTQHAGLAWGLLGIFVSAAIRNNENHDCIKNHESIARIMCRASALARIYLNDHNILDDVRETLKKDLQDLYENVLKWLISAVKFTQHGQIMHALQAFAGNTTVQTSMAAIRKQEDEVFKSQRVAEVSLHYDSPQYIRKLWDLVIELRDRVTADERQLLLQWISDEPYLDHQNAVFDAAMPDTSKWLLEDQKVQDWRNSKHSRVLWMKGKRGSGLSTVASVFIDSLIQKTKSGQGDGQFAFFYCQRPNPASKSVSVRQSLYACLLRQLLSPSSVAFPLGLARWYDEMRGAGSITIHLCMETFNQHIQSQPGKTLLIIDGLEKVPRYDRTTIMHELGKMVEALDPKLQIIISSTWERDMEQAIQKLGPVATMVEMESSRDIEAFIEHQVSVDFDIGRLSPDLRTVKPSIISGLRERHGGRFLWVQFSLQSLRRRGSPEAVLRRLRQLPEGLNELYGNTYAAIEAELDPPDMRTVRLAFLFTLYGNPWVGITTEEILEAIHGRRLTQAERERLFEFCSGFLQEDLISKREDPANDRCRFSHVYVNDFLRSHPDFEEKAAQTEIGDICFSKALSLLSPASQARWKKGDFFCYAITQWLQHYLEPVLAAMRSADHSELFQVLEQLDAKLSARLSSYTNHAASLSPSFETCVKHVQKTLRTVEEQGFTPLKILLESVVGMTSSPSNALFAAALWGDAQILDYADHVQDALWQQTNVQGLTALQYARASAYRVRLGPPLQDRQSFVAQMQRASMQLSAE